MEATTEGDDVITWIDFVSPVSLIEKHNAGWYQ